jgi:hypothetical protein
MPWLAIQWKYSGISTSLQPQAAQPIFSELMLDFSIFWILEMMCIA